MGRLCLGALGTLQDLSLPLQLLSSLSWAARISSSIMTKSAFLDLSLKGPTIILTPEWPGARLCFLTQLLPRVLAEVVLSGLVSSMFIGPLGCTTAVAGRAPFP